MHSLSLVPFWAKFIKAGKRYNRKDTLLKEEKKIPIKNNNNNKPYEKRCLLKVRYLNMINLSF